MGDLRRPDSAEGLPDVQIGVGASATKDQPASFRLVDQELIRLDMAIAPTPALLTAQSVVPVLGVQTAMMTQRLNHGLSLARSFHVFLEERQSLLNCLVGIASRG